MQTKLWGVAILLHSLPHVYLALESHPSREGNVHPWILENLLERRVVFGVANVVFRLLLVQMTSIVADKSIVHIFSFSDVGPDTETVGAFAEDM
jgi:hypothetical protein